jgi:hypothetical protein
MSSGNVHVVGSSGKADKSTAIWSDEVMAAIDGDLLLGNVCPKSENSFPEGGLEINASTSAGRSMNGKYTSGASGVNEAGEVSP